MPKWEIVAGGVDVELSHHGTRSPRIRLISAKSRVDRLEKRTKP